MSETEIPPVSRGGYLFYNCMPTARTVPLTGRSQSAYKTYPIGVAAVPQNQKRFQAAHVDHLVSYPIVPPVRGNRPRDIPSVRLLQNQAGFVPHSHASIGSLLRRIHHTLAHVNLRNGSLPRKIEQPCGQARQRKQQQGKPEKNSCRVGNTEAVHQILSRHVKQHRLSQKKRQAQKHLDPKPALYPLPYVRRNTERCIPKQSLSHCAPFAMNTE